jgi:predicted acetyltransferase
LQRADKPVLESVMPCYAYDFSELMALDVGEDVAELVLRRYRRRGVGAAAAAQAFARYRRRWEVRQRLPRSRRPAARAARSSPTTSAGADRCSRSTRARAVEEVHGRAGRAVLSRT